MEETSCCKIRNDISVILSVLVNRIVVEAGNEIKWSCMSMKILFSAAMNFKMIKKTQSVDSKGSLEHSRADRVMNKQKVVRLTWQVGSLEKWEKVKC